MDPEFEKFRQSIKPRHYVAFTPKYKESFGVSISAPQFIAVSLQTFEQLGWEPMYYTDEVVEARIKSTTFSGGYYISVSFNVGIAEVSSKSEGNEMWDMGRNSKNVKLFIYAFEKIKSSYDSNALINLGKERERIDNWDDYQLPDTLPQPREKRTPRVFIFAVAGIVVSLLLGLAIAFMSVKFMYIIGLTEIAVALILGFTLNYFMKIAAFTDFQKMQYFLYAFVFITYASNQYFQYEIILSQHNYERIGFYEFMKLRLEAGLKIQNLQLTWIGLIVSWLLQLVISGLVLFSYAFYSVTRYRINKVPVEVADFATYHYIRSESEDKVRKELAKMGWKDTEDQDDVFGAMSSRTDALVLRRG